MHLLWMTSSGLLLAFGAPERSPEKLLSDPSLLATPMELPLVPSQTSPVFLAEAGKWQSNLHSYLTYFDGRFWVTWSSSREREDGSEQVIRFTTSKDGHHWAESSILVDDPDGPDRPQRWIARGIFVQDEKLLALNARLDGPRETPEGRESWANLRLMLFEWTGEKWEDRGIYIENCMNNYPPRVVDGRLFITCRDSFARMHTALADSTSGAHWTITPLPGETPHDDMSEPSGYVDPEGTAHLIFRDGAKSGYLYRSISLDGGSTWTAPLRTNYPDAPGKNLTGRLSNGWYYLISNPNQAGRDPLVISFSRDGWVFGNPRALRKGVRPQRVPGPGKNPGFQYPHALEKDGSLWVVYNVTQEDIEISEYKIVDFQLKKLGN
jgi:hypothetical protein